MAVKGKQKKIKKKLQRGKKKKRKACNFYVVQEKTINVTLSHRREQASTSDSFSITAGFELKGKETKAISKWAELCEL